MTGRDEIRVMSPGKLGHGCNPSEVAAALACDPDVIGVDAGTSDIGPYHLGAGVPFFPPMAVAQDLGLLLPAARARRIPLVVGNALSAGTNALLDQALNILRDVAREHNITARVAIVRSEVSRNDLLAGLEAGRIEPLGAPARLTAADVRDAVAVVAQMGVEPLIRALDQGADVVLAGRACDDALFAALPIREGFEPGLALHMGKILECGSMACVPGDLHGSLVGTLRRDHFDLVPPAAHRVCTVHSVASHTLYERADPYLQPGPGGTNDLRGSRFEPVGDRGVRVTGSRWVPAPAYAVKLEGARFAGHRSICITGIRDSVLIACLDDVLAQAEADTAARFGAHRDRYRIVFRQYGRNAVMGRLEPRAHERPHEVGLMIEVVAATQELADAVCMYVRGTVQHAHYPGIVATAGNLAYPISPFVVPAGPVYMFHIEHLMRLDDPCECFPIEMEQVGHHVTAAAALSGS